MGEDWQAQFFHTKLCPHYVMDIEDERAAREYGPLVGNAQGICVNGDHCRFAHSFRQLRPLPDLSKTKLCPSRLTCADPTCNFAHSPKDLRTSSTNFYKVTLCNFYKNHKCWNGPNCRFAHGEEDLRPPPNGPRPTHAHSENRLALGSVRSEQGLLPTPQSRSSGRVRERGRAESAANLLENLPAAEALFSLLFSTATTDVWSAAATEAPMECGSAVSAAITSDEVALPPSGESLSSLASSRPASPPTAEAREGSRHPLLSVLREALNLPSDDFEEDQFAASESDPLELLMQALDRQSLDDDDDQHRTM